MIDNKLNIIQGPVLETTVKCNKCKYVTFITREGHASSVVPNFCNKLNIKLEIKSSSCESWTIIPDNNCPFLLENSERFYKQEIANLYSQEKEKYKKILTEIFPNHYDYEFEKDHLGYVLRITSSESIDSNDLRKITESLPEWSITINPNESDSLFISFRKNI